MIERIRAYLAIRRVSTDSRLRSALHNAVTEYRSKNVKPTGADQVSFGEAAFIALPPSQASQREREVLERVAEARAQVGVAEAEFTAADLALSTAVRQPPPTDAPVVEAEDRLREIIDAAAKILEVRKTIQGQLELRRLVSKKLAWGLGAILALADFLTLWAALNKSFDVAILFKRELPFIELSDPLQFFSNLFISLMGTTIIIVCASIVGEAVAARRAKRYADEVDDQVSGVDASSRTGTDRWYHRFGTWFSEFRQGPHVGKLLVCLTLILATSTIYFVIVRYRFQNAEYASGYESVIAVIAGLFFILPLVAVVVNVASSNQLKDILNESESKIKLARQEVSREEAELERIRLQSNERIAALDLARAAANNSRKAALGRLESLLSVSEASLRTLIAQHDDEVKVGLFTVRSLVDKFGIEADRWAKVEGTWSKRTLEELATGLSDEREQVRQRLAAI